MVWPFLSWRWLGLAACLIANAHDPDGDEDDQNHDDHNDQATSWKVSSSLPRWWLGLAARLIIDDHDPDDDNDDD